MPVNLIVPRVCSVGCVLFAALVGVLTVRADQSSDHQTGPRENVPGVWALTNARLVLEPGMVLERGTLVIRRGKIAAAGTDIPIPAEARQINLDGKTIYPGFIDAFAERALPTDGLSETAAYWNDKVVPQLRVADHAGAISDAEALRKQGITAQLIAPSGGVIRGQSALLSTGSGTPNQLIIAADVAQHAELTVPRSRGGSYPSSPMGAVALARQAFYDAQWLRDSRAAVRAEPSLPLPERNDALDALQPVLRGAQPLVVETSNEAFILRADRFAAEFGIRVIVRGNGNEYRRLQEIRDTGRAIILPLDFPDAPNVSTPEIALDVTLESLMHWDLAPENPARVAEAGIAFALTTHGLDSPKDFLKALRKAVSAGLDEEAALRALTETPAELLGVDHQLGSLHSGRIASLVITDGDVFDEDTTILETWVAGQRFEHQTPPARQVEGDYELRLAPSPGHPAKLFLRLSQDGQKLTGRIARAPFPAESPADESPSSDDDTASADGDSDGDDARTPPGRKLAGLKLSDTSVSASFDTGDWDLEGVSRLTLVFSEAQTAEEGADVGFGGVVWPDGTYVSAIAHVASTVLPSPKARKDKDAESGKSSGSSFPVNYPLGAYGRDALPQPTDVVAFTNATIWTSGPDGIIENGTLLIRGGRIIGTGQGLHIPEDAVVVDLAGQHVTPGIIDCHSHMATDGGVNEGTQAVTCEVRIGDFIDADDITIYRQLAGGVTCANILHGSANPIGGQNQVIKLRWGMTGEQMKFVQAPQGVKFALGENVKQSNWSQPTGRYPQTRMGVEQIFRDSFEAARDYGRRMDRWQRSRRGLPPRRDLELDALREILDQTRWIHCHSYRQDEILALIRLLDEYDITIGTFQHILEGYKVADAMAAHGAMASAFSDWWAYKLEVYDAIPYAGALMHDAGIVVSFNSDDSELARHLNQEAAKAVKYGGVPRAEALKFVTLNPARQLRIDKYVGSLEPGKHADFVVWSDDPLSNYARCEQTWIDGRRYFDRDEDRVLQETAASRRNTLIQKILKSDSKMRDVGERDRDPAQLWPRHDEFCHHFHHDDEFEFHDRAHDSHE